MAATGSDFYDGKMAVIAKAPQSSESSVSPVLIKSWNIFSPQFTRKKKVTESSE